MFIIVWTPSHSYLGRWRFRKMAVIKGNSTFFSINVGVTYDGGGDLKMVWAGWSKYIGNYIVFHSSQKIFLAVLFFSIITMFISTHLENARQNDTEIIIRTRQYKNSFSFFFLNSMVIENSICVYKKQQIKNKKETKRKKNGEKDTLRERHSFLELLRSVFSCIRTEYSSISPYSVGIRKNTDQNNSEYQNFLRSDSLEGYFL